MRTKGWKQVFSFTYLQNVKAKSFRVSTIIMSIIIILICVGINIIPTLISDEQLSGFFGEDGSINEIKTLYVCDESGLSVPMDLSSISDAGVSIQDIKSEDITSKRQEVTDSNAAVILLVAEKTEKDGYIITVYRPESEEVIGAGAANALADEAYKLFDNALLQSYGVDKENLEAVKESISTDVTVYSDKPSRSEAQMAMSAIVPMFSAIIFFSFIISYSQLIGQSVAVEKTSRVMELLLTSVRPLAVIIGKVIAMLMVALTQLTIFGACGTAAFFISMPFGFIPKAFNTASEAISNATAQATAEGSPALAEVGQQIAEAIPGFNVLTIVEIILVFILGFLFYALLAGLVGASVSRIEDLATAMQPMMFIALIGFFISYFPAVFNIDNESGNNVLLTIARYLPISSPFALPSALLLGEMNAAESAISVVALGIFVVLTAMLVSKVYEHIVLYTGNPLKFSQLLKFAKNDK